MLHDISELYPYFDRRETKVKDASSIIDGNPHKYERESLIRIVEWVKARTVFEFGTFNGATAAALALIPSVETVWTLDIPEGAEPALPMLEIDRNYMHFDKRARLTAPKVEYLFGDSALFDFSPYYGRCEVVFVMGAHSLPYIRSDIGNAMRMVTPDGCVVWHAGTPEPVETIAQEYDVFLMSERMGLVKQPERVVSGGS